MEEKSVEEAGPDQTSEDVSVAGDLDGEEPTKPADESCAAEETEQTAAEEDEDEDEEEVYVRNAEEKPGEDFGASAMDDLPVSADCEEGEAPDVEICPAEDGGEEPESRAEEDHGQCRDDHQYHPEVDPELLLELRTEHGKLSRLNRQLQTRLAEYFRLKSDGDPQQKTRGASGARQTYPEILEDIRKQMQDKQRNRLRRQRVDELQRQSEEKLERVEREWSALASAERDVLAADQERVAGETSERLLTAAQKCEQEFLSVRHENVKLNLKLLKPEAGLHGGKEALDGEMRRIDFEQLKMEKEAYDEKIQEYTEDLLKLKKTLPHIEQIALHVKEKLWFIQAENRDKRERSDELDAAVPREQEALTQTMQARDLLRFDSLRMRRDCGLLGNPTLLRDLEDTEDEREALRRHVEELKRGAEAR